MPDIWGVLHESEDHGGLPWIGIWAIGDLLTVPDHKWSRTNAWAYDGIIYGYRELGALGDSNYWLLGQRMYVTNPTAEDDATYLTELAALNAGCNVDWRAFGSDMLPTINDNGDGTVTISCGTSGGDPANVIKASMPAWGIVRDILTFNTPGPSEAMLGMSYGLLSGDVQTIITTPSPAAGAQWAIWGNEVIALWIE